MGSAAFVWPKITTQRQIGLSQRAFIGSSPSDMSLRTEARGGCIDSAESSPSEVLVKCGE